MTDQEAAARSWYPEVIALAQSSGWTAVGQRGDQGYWSKYGDYDDASALWIGPKIAQYQASQDRGFDLGGILTSFVGNPLGNVAFTTPTSVIGRASIAAGAPLIAGPALSAAQSFLPGEMSTMDLSDIRDQLRAALNTAGAFIDKIDANAQASILGTQPAVQQAGIGSNVLGALGGMLTLGGGARLVAGLVKTASGAIRGVMTAAGKFISTKKAVDMAKRFGLEAAAVALGIGVADMASMVLQHSGKKSRGRGISARDLRVASRTMRKIERFHSQIHKAARSAVSHRR